MDKAFACRRMPEDNELMMRIQELNYDKLLGEVNVR